MLMLKFKGNMVVQTHLECFYKEEVDQGQLYRIGQEKQL
jgi:hypothetical protein